MTCEHGSGRPSRIIPRPDAGWSDARRRGKKARGTDCLFRLRMDTQLRLLLHTWSVESPPDDSPLAESASPGAVHDAPRALAPRGADPRADRGARARSARRFDSGRCRRPERTALGGGSRLEALYVTGPVYLPNEFGSFDLDDDRRGVIGWLVPLTAREAHFARKHGRRAFEQQLERQDPDLLSHDRSRHHRGRQIGSRHVA